MGQGFAEGLLDQASQILGFDIKNICLRGPFEELKKTTIAQPAIFIVSVAALQKLKSKGLWPVEALAGHSLGEYTALYAAGVISFEDGVKILHLRGKFMQEAVPLGQGAMSAVLNLDRENVKKCCRDAGGLVYPANYNSPDQIVISGEAAAVRKAGELCKNAGAKRVIPLQVSAPFHCPLMLPAQEKLEKEMDMINIADAAIPVYANVSAVKVTQALKIKQSLIKQVTAPVLWEDSVKNMIGAGINNFVEIGPGKVLINLVKKIDKTVSAKNYEEVLNEA